ncbi:hypothetical protein GCM10025858_36090 [Alicyclobacillus sacchari]|nr:hypothetical protein GCM10025858_00140 [Alicyclobacillus sacchari]GMA59106.1 hypothetical protein GCM10025858_36090 [Alicyclobacillus sacchari]
MCSQTATVAAYHLAHMVALHYRDLPLFDLYSPQTQAAFYNGQLQALRPLILRNIEALRMHSAYAQYREYVEPLFAMIEAGQTWDETRDVRREWEVPLVRTTPAKRRLRRAR